MINLWCYFLLVPYRLSYSPCNVALVILSIYSLRYHVLQVISVIDVPHYMMPNCLESSCLVSCFSSSPLTFPLLLHTLAFPFLSKECHFLIWVTSSLCELTSFKISSLCFYLSIMLSFVFCKTNYLMILHNLSLICWLSLINFCTSGLSH